MLHHEWTPQHATGSSLRRFALCGPAGRRQRPQPVLQTQIAAGRAAPVVEADPELGHEGALDLGQEGAGGPARGYRQARGKEGSWLSQQFDETQSLSQQYHADQVMEGVRSPQCIACPPRVCNGSPTRSTEAVT